MVTRSFWPLPSRTRISLRREVEVLDAQAQGLREAQARAVEQRRDEPRLAAEVGEHAADLLAREDDGEARGLARADEGRHLGEGLLEDVAVQEEERRERLVLGGGGDLAVGGEGGEEGVDLRLAQLVGVALAVEEDEALHPLDVRLLRAQRVVPRAEGRAQAVEEAGRWGGLI